MEKLIKNGLSSAQLKYIAVLSMLIDHIAVVLLNPVSITYWISRFIGRLAFPIFVFLMVEGFRKTSNRLNYIKRIFIFAIISEVPFDLAFFRLFDFSHQNVLFNLGIGALMLFIIEKYKKKPYVKYVALIVAAVVAWATRTDYGYIGILLAAVFYYIRQPMQQIVCGSIVLLSEPPAILAFGPILLYNGKRGRRLKYFFYIFYPLHLLILYGLARLIFFGVH